MAFGAPGNSKKKAKTHKNIQHAELIKKTGKSPLLTQVYSNSKAATVVDHGELIAIDGDENAIYDNSSDREGDVRAGAGAGDDVIKL